MFNYKITIETNNERTTFESNDVNELNVLIDSYIELNTLVGINEGEYVEVNLVDNTTGEVYFYYIVEATSHEIRTRTYKSDFYREYFC
jgi:hypothetical protein